MVLLMSEVTRILDAMERGDPQAFGRLLPLVYGELRRLAAQRLAQEKPGQTLQATALVHEAYLRLVVPASASSGDETSKAHWHNRRHFFAAAAEAMRRILVENARRKRRQKRGGAWQRIALDEEVLAAPERDERLLALDEALERFAALEQEKAELLKLRFFAGMSLDTAAALLGISPSTADRWWAYARAWLRVEIGEETVVRGEGSGVRKPP
jgi:RNA polymerase sigma factor (TIGR02999 family)